LAKLEVVFCSFAKVRLEIHVLNLYKGFFIGEKMAQICQILKEKNSKSSDFYDKFHFLAKNIKWFVFFSSFISSNQIWLNHLMDGCHYSYITTDYHFDTDRSECQHQTRFFMKKTNPNSLNFEDNNFKLPYFYDMLL